MLVVILTILIGILSLLLILWPYIENKSLPPISGDFLRKYESLLFERERVLLNIKDLELDLSMQKIDQTDFQNLRTQLLSEAAKIYSSIEQIENENIFFKKLAQDLKKEEEGFT